MPAPLHIVREQPLDPEQTRVLRRALFKSTFLNPWVLALSGFLVLLVVGIVVLIRSASRKQKLDRTLSA